ncbi:hypothetical protein SAMN04487900_12433 [Prevotella communis]|jgi:hypothetical protein|uniref:ABC-three component systems C-terminal domain-containing protein n=2 Tax=Prevotella communis TaxID=2913614 RepID=A0A1H0KAS3_9BACT|nr:hypothetical protein SAMN04487900_12433 [Prevotella communis]
MPDSQMNIGTAGSVNPNATSVNDTYNFYGTALPTRMDAYFQSLLKEIENGITEDVFDALDYYKTKLDGTKDLEEKLTDGGFRPSRIAEAIRLKEMFAKIAMRYDCYPSAQKIIHSLFARIKHEFDDNIFPLIESQQPLNIVMKQIRERIVIPIRDMLEANGAHDTVLGFNEDHIYGMIYYLTGMCHLNWKDYDNV